jgi:Mg2+ and Co2+ transporter CorA
MEKDKQQSRQTRRNKVRVVSARFTDIEYQAVEKRRKDAGVSLSRFVHSVLLTGKVVQRISKADADVLRKLAGEANNINQLAHKANAGGVAAELMMLKKKIVQIIKQLSDDWKNK